MSAQDETSIALTIPALTGLAAGGSSVLYYEVSWDSGLNQASWPVYSVVPSSTSTISIISLTSGATYAFRYRAQNVHGWSSGYSPVTLAVAMRAPGQVGVVTTAMDGTDTLLIGNTGTAVTLGGSDLQLEVIRGFGL